MSASRPIVLSDDAEPERLPSRTARHATLGFDANDISALLSSINASQRSETSTLPDLPAEILLTILEFVPVHHILRWRLVCRAFRDAVNGRVLHQYITRAQLIGYLGPRSEYPLSRLSKKEYERVYLVRADFEKTEEQAVDAENGEAIGPKWNRPYAIFRIEDKWFDHIKNFRQNILLNAGTGRNWDHVLDSLQLMNDDETYGTLRWCIQVDKAVLDIPFKSSDWLTYMAVDLEHRIIRLEWRPLLFEFVKTETALKKMMKERRPPYTFGRRKDCTLALRRQRLRSALDFDDSRERRLKWAMNLLPPLFGKPRYDRASAPWDRLEDAERTAMKILSFLHREAGIDPRERAYLHKLAAERKTMQKQLDDLNNLYTSWKEKVFVPGMLIYPPKEKLPDVPINPVAWSDEIRTTEETRIRKWKTQQRTIEQMVLLMKASNEAVAAPSDAFDDSGSDFG